MLEPKQNEEIHIGMAWQEVLKPKQVKEHPCLGAPPHEVPESKLGEDSFNTGEVAWYGRGQSPSVGRTNQTLEKSKLGFRV